METQIPQAKNAVQVKRLEAKGYFRPVVVAAKVGVHKATVYRWIKDNKVKFISFSGNYFVEWKSVSHLLGDFAEILDIV